MRGFSGFVRLPSNVMKIPRERFMRMENHIIRLPQRHGAHRVVQGVRIHALR